MDLLDEKEFLNRLRAEEPRAFKEFYQKYYQKAANFIIKNSGTDGEAQDVFQEAIVVLLRYLRKPDFQLNDNVKIDTFFIGILKRMWFGQLKKKKKELPLTANAENLDLQEEGGVEEKIVYEAKHDLIAKYMADLSEDCRKILSDFYYKKIQLQEIAVTMDYTQNFVRVKKNRCMNNLKKLVKSDNNYPF